MKINTVLTSVNDNPKYTKFIPLFIQTWKKMYPLIRVRIIYIGDEIPSLYADYSEYFTLFHAIDGISTVYTAQTIRILYPALLHDDDVTVITDMDMIPGNSTYFLEDVPNDSFLIFRPLSCVGVNEIAICYNAASTSTWRDLCKIDSTEDVKNFLINNYHGSDGQHGGQGWSQDQLLLFASVWQSNKPRKVLDDSTFNRLDFYHHQYHIETFVRLLKTNNHSDAHLYADLCSWTPGDINTIGVRLDQ
jgi:hypothetical protein